MSTYLELLAATEDEAFNNKVRFSVLVAINKVQTEPEATVNHANRMVWAKEAIANPDPITARVVRLILAEDKGIAVATILAYTDANIQAKANAAIDLLAGV